MTTSSSTRVTRCPCALYAYVAPVDSGFTALFVTPDEISRLAGALPKIPTSYLRRHNRVIGDHSVHSVECLFMREVPFDSGHISISSTRSLSS